jgi:hypothetical protein
MGTTIPARLAVLASVALVSITVLILAWPRFQSSFRYLAVDIAIARYHTDQQIPSGRLVLLIDYARQAIGRHDHYRYRDGLSQLHYLRGLDPYTPALERLPAYREAESEAMASLRQAPAQPEAWLRLATVRWLLHDEPDAILEPWKMSIFTGRTHSALYSQRVEMGLAHRAFLDDEAIPMLRGQMMLAWKIRPGALVQVLARRDPELIVTRELLLPVDPAALLEMEAVLDRVR